MNGRTSVRVRSVGFVAAGAWVGACVALGGCASEGGRAGFLEPVAVPAGEPTGLLKIVRDQLPDERTPFTLVVSLTVKGEHGAEFEGLAREAMAGTRRERGSRIYHFSRGASNPSEVVLYEEWRSFADLRMHFEYAHTKRLLESVGRVALQGPEVRVFLPVNE